MTEEWISKTELSRQLSFEEWLDRKDEYCPFSEDENWWEAEADSEYPEVKITCFLEVSEWEKAKEYLIDQYWKEVESNFHLFNDSLETRWKELADPVIVERIIDAWTYALYPEKYLNRPLPIMLSIFPYYSIRSENDEPDFYRQIAIAYAEIQRDGRTELQTLKQLTTNRHCLAEGLKKSLDWAKKFKSFIESSGRLDELAYEDFVSCQEQLPTLKQSSQDRQVKTIRQAAIVLRYEGKMVMSPSADPKREADRLVYQLAGKKSPTSGLQLYRHWVEERVSPNFYRGLVNDFYDERAHKAKVTRRITDLKAVLKYFAEQPLAKRVRADLSTLEDALNCT